MHGLSYIQEKLNDLLPQKFSGKIYVYKNSFSICARKQISQAHNDLLCSSYQKKKPSANERIDWVSEGIDEICWGDAKGNLLLPKFSISISPKPNSNWLFWRNKAALGFKYFFSKINQTTNGRLIIHVAVDSVKPFESFHSLEFDLGSWWKRKFMTGLCDVTHISE